MPTNVKDLTDEELEEQLTILHSQVPDYSDHKKKKVKKKRTTKGKKTVTQANLTALLKELKEITIR